MNLSLELRRKNDIGLLQIIDENGCLTNRWKLVYPTIFQQDGAKPHWHDEVRTYLNEQLPRRWIEKPHLRLATPVTGPHSVRFLSVGFCER